MKCGEGLSSLKRRHVEEAAPNLGGGEATGHKARDDAEIIGAAFEGMPEVGVE